MKKILLPALLLVSALALTGCGNKAKANESVETVKIAYLPITHSLAVLEEANQLQTANENIVYIDTK